MALVDPIFLPDKTNSTNNSTNNFNNNHNNNDNNHNNNHNNNNKNKDGCDRCNMHKYEEDIIKDIQWIYILAGIVWLILVYVLGLLKPDIIVLLILLIPIIVYAINFVSISEHLCLIENQMFKGNFLYFAFITAIILINWNKDINSTEKHDLFKIVIIALILLMLSMVDVWLDPKQFAIVKHVRTTLHTASLTLLALALYMFYIFQFMQTSA